MFGFLLLIFIALPFIELYFLFQVGGIIGAANTFVLVIMIGACGALLTRSQGRLVWMQFQAQMVRGQLPQDSLIHGLFIFLGGVLLITPGFVTDLVGLLLVAPGLRHLMVKRFKNSLKNKMSQGRVQVFQFGRFGGGAARPPFGSQSPYGPREEREAQVVDVIPEKSEHSGPNE